jgi:hypothetical protein
MESGLALVLIAQLVTLPLALACHELGHASAAILMGMQVRKISIGGGRPLFKRMWGRINVKFAWGRLSGYVVAVPAEGRGAAVRLAAMIAAGPAANLLMIAIVFEALPWRSFDLETWGLKANLALGWGLANLVVVGATLNAHHVSLPFSDREQLSLLWRMPDAWLDMHRGNKDVENTPQAIERAGRDRLRRVEALLAHPRLSRRERGRLLDNYCTIVLVTGWRDEFEQAMVYSGELFAQRGGELTVQGTRGSLLVLCGRTDDGAAMLEMVYASSRAPVDRAF